MGTRARGSISPPLAAPPCCAGPQRGPWITRLRARPRPYAAAKPGILTHWRSQSGWGKGQVLFSHSSSSFLPDSSTTTKSPPPGMGFGAITAPVLFLFPCGERVTKRRGVSFLTSLPLFHLCPPLLLLLLSPFLPCLLSSRPGEGTEKKARRQVRGLRGGAPGLKCFPR